MNGMGAIRDKLHLIDFPTGYHDILTRITEIDPVKYGKTRNFIDGAVTYLSPYLSRGVISTRQVLKHIKNLHLPFYQVEKLVQELAWRDYWQQVWIEKGDGIDEDLRRVQPDVVSHSMPMALLNAETGIDTIDLAIQGFYKNGYLHNHIRMYIAAIACNMAKSHWRVPARWMYFHLLDGDWASNALSWQWVAGANSNKKYLANQENINKYCHSDQTETFLDMSYPDLSSSDIPVALEQPVNPELITSLPKSHVLRLDQSIPTVLYNSYNLDPTWKSDIKANRILLLEPSHFEKYPVASKVIDFILSLGKNIPELQLYVGEFHELAEQFGGQDVYFKEHPSCRHYHGVEDKREWMFSVSGYYPSFFGFWKKCRKELDWT